MYTGTQELISLITHQPTNVPTVRPVQVIGGYAANRIVDQKALKNDTSLR
jgi:hypothetical protein